MFCGSAVRMVQMHRGPRAKCVRWTLTPWPWASFLCRRIVVLSAPPPSLPTARPTNHEAERGTPGWQMVNRRRADHTHARSAQTERRPFGSARRTRTRTPKA